MCCDIYCATSAGDEPSREQLLINVKDSVLSSLRISICLRGIGKCFKFCLLDRFVKSSNMIIIRAVQNSVVILDFGISDNPGTEAHHILFFN